MKLLKVWLVVPYVLCSAEHDPMASDRLTRDAKASVPAIIQKPVPAPIISSTYTDELAAGPPHPPVLVPAGPAPVPIPVPAGPAPVPVPAGPAPVPIPVHAGPAPIPAAPVPLPPVPFRLQDILSTYLLDILFLLLQQCTLPPEHPTPMLSTLLLNLNQFLLRQSAGLKRFS